jgi:tRNA-2-methylthio-N6-dimethylallyladenosine synthase
MQSTKKYHITSFGCQMNKNDSERIAAILASLGMVATEEEEEADVIILNTCSVRQSAEERIFGAQKKYLAYKKERPEVIVGVTGCMPGRDKEHAFHKRLPGTDLYFATHEMIHLPRWIAELRPEWFEVASSSVSVVPDEAEAEIRDPGLLNPMVWTRRPVRSITPQVLVPARLRDPHCPATRLQYSDSNNVKNYLSVSPLRAPSAQAFVTIQTGCHQFCTYCVVPYARGLEKNRSAKDILDECRKLIEEGVIEITLLGQAVNAYRAPDPETFSKANPFHDHFAALLWEINSLSGLARVHWTASHPNYMMDEVIAALALPKQVNFLHLPVQSGNSEILTRMNRKYSREQYLKRIEQIKQARPGIALGTDIIVGFCGETVAQFQDTISLYREVQFDISYNAQYSQRSGTLSAKIFQDDVSKEEKQDRWWQMQRLMEEIVLQKNQAFVGKSISVLVDRVEGGFAGGTSSELKYTRFSSQDASLIGKIVEVKIVEAKTWVLEGSVLPISKGEIQRGSPQTV